MQNRFTISLIFIFCMMACASHAQLTKYIVVFKNKNNSPYSINKPQQFLSQKAIDRRTRYNINIDTSDLPVTPWQIKQVLSQGSITYLSQSKWLNQVLIYVPDSSVLKKIRQLSFVKMVMAVAPLSTTSKSISNDKFEEKISPLKNNNLQEAEAANTYNYGHSYAQIHIHNGEFLHNKGLTGKGITIAIIDAGFYAYKTTTAFDSARAHNQFLGEKDFVDFDNSVNEDDSHGEYCLSIIAANVPGVMVGSAPDADFYLLRSENVHSEYPVEEHNWAVAAEFADSVGADMISSSLGYNQFDDAQFNHTYSQFYKNETMVSRAATFASKKGILVTNSAGNEGNNSWKYIIFPADDDSVCAVGATDTSGNIASFSSYGYPGRVKPNIVSVGSGTTIYSSAGVSSGSGTSFSNPNINGLIACLWQAFPSFNNITILDAVYKSCDRYKTPDNHFGYGIPNMQKAYDTLLKEKIKGLFGNKVFIAIGHPARKLTVTFVGHINGIATLKVMDETQKIVSTKTMKIEYGQVYNVDFEVEDNDGLNSYTISYDDGTTIEKFSVPGKAISYKN